MATCTIFCPPGSCPGINGNKCVSNAGGLPEVCGAPAVDGRQCGFHAAIRRGEQRAYGRLPCRACADSAERDLAVLDTDIFGKLLALKATSAKTSNTIK